MKKIYTITLLLILINHPANSQQSTVYFSVIPDSIKWSYQLVEFEVKITNPDRVSKRFRIRASCIDEKGIIKSYKEKDYEVMKTEDTTQIYISNISQEQCKTINLQASEGNFWK